MSEKVVLTQEQAEAIEKESYRDYENILYDYLVVSDYDEKFKGLTFGGLYRALHQGYEVEETFEVGDWVVDVYEGITKIRSKENNGLWIGNENTAIWLHHEGECYERLRHATPEEIKAEKERRWWKKRGRKPWELQEDDILEYLGDLYIVDCFDSEMVCLKSGIERKSNYAEPFGFVKKHFKIVCLAESRLDVSE